MNYEQQLQALKAAQQKAVQNDLKNVQENALSNLNKEQQDLSRQYDSQRNSANIQNRLAQKNYREILSNSGKSNSGIVPQANLSYSNSLLNNISGLNANESLGIADVGRRTTLANNQYANDLQKANSEIEANYITQLLSEQQKEWERKQSEAQFEWEKSQKEREFQEQIRQFNAEQSRLISASRQKSKETESFTESSKKTSVTSNMSPAFFSTKTARDWYDSGLGKLSTQGPIDVGVLESELIKARDSGVINNNDINSILKVWK